MLLFLSWWIFLLTWCAVNKNYIDTWLDKSQTIEEKTIEEKTREEAREETKTEAIKVYNAETFYLKDLSQPMNTKPTNNDWSFEVKDLTNTDNTIRLENSKDTSLQIIDLTKPSNTMEVETTDFVLKDYNIH